MRITVVIGAFLSMPPAPAGAIEKVWADLSRSFAASGHDVTVLCPAWGDLPEDSVLDGVRYLRLSGFDRSGSTWSDLWYDYRYSKAIRSRLPDADVTVFNCFWLPRMVRGRKHLGLLDFHLQRFPKRQMFLYRHVDRISTVSDAIGDAVKAQAPRLASRIDVIPNPVDTTVFRPDPERTAGETLNLVFHGRVHPEKGLDVLVDACRIIHDEGISLKTSIIGPHEVGQGGGGDAFLADLRKRAEGIDLRFEGRIVGQAALVERLQDCDIHCYPSMAFYGEASPVAPLEAMACGAVPVVSDLPQFSGYVKDRDTGMVFTREGDGVARRLADAIIELIQNPELRAKLRTATMAQAERCRVDAIAADHLAAWERLGAGR
jgi:glycosyltransferase involved in cell wall biosynthesis